VLVVYGEFRGPDVRAKLIQRALSGNRRNTIGIIEQREDVGIGELAAQRLDYFFTAPHLEKPVMDDR
jgi:hypothetical protein